jgi:hypothetical protein
MPSTITANNLRPLHAKRLVRVSRHRSLDRIEICRPSAAGFEFVTSFVEGCVAADAGVDAFGGLVFVVFAREGRFGALFAEDAELFCEKEVLVDARN